MEVVFFTNKCSHGAEILKGMADNQIHLKAIFIEHERSQSRFLAIKKVIQRDGYWELLRQILKKLVYRAVPFSSPDWQRDDYYLKYADRVIAVNSFNGNTCEEELQAIQPDIVVLGGASIIRSHILKIPRIGLLNAHPGLLPEYRGVDVIPWAILNEDSVGVTIHFVDKGIDTGRICASETLSIRTDDTIASLRKRAEEVAGRVMAQTLLEIIIKKDAFLTLLNPKEGGKQYYKMSRKMLKMAEKKLKERSSGGKSNLSG